MEYWKYDRHCHGWLRSISIFNELILHYLMFRKSLL